MPFRNLLKLFAASILYEVFMCLCLWFEKEKEKGQRLLNEPTVSVDSVLMALL